MTERFSDEVLKRADEAYSLALIGYEPMDHTQAASIERNRRACAAMRAVLEGHEKKPTPVEVSKEWCLAAARDEEGDCTTGQPEDARIVALRPFTCACGDEFDSLEQFAAHVEMGHGAATDGSPR